MTKNTDRSIIFCVVFFAVLAFWGCAGQVHRSENNGLQASGPGDVNSAGTVGAVETVKPVEVAKVAEEQKRPHVVVDDTSEFEFIKTPFGYVKRRIKRTESSPALLPPAVTASVPEGEGSDKPAQPPEPPPPPKAIEETTKTIPEGKGGITFNFDNADIYEVIRTISEILQINYIVDPSVRGNVTIRTTRGLSKEDIFPVFGQILEASGLMIVKEGAIYNIVRMKDVSRMPLALRSERDAQDIPPGERTVIQIIPLKFITAQEMAKLLTPFVSSAGAIIADAPSNTLLVVDKGINILKVLKLTDVFDINLLEKVSHKFYFFKNIDAEEASKTLKEISASYPTSGNDRLALIPINRLNAVLAITSHIELLEKLDAFVAQLDIPSESVEPRIYVYSVRNGEAVQLSDLLNTIFGKGETVSKTNTLVFVLLTVSPFPKIV